MEIEKILLKQAIETIEALQVSDFKDRADIVSIINWHKIQEVRLNLIDALKLLNTPVK